MSMILWKKLYIGENNFVGIKTHQSKDLANILYFKKGLPKDCKLTPLKGDLENQKLLNQTVTWSMCVCAIKYLLNI